MNIYKEDENNEAPNTELYAILNVSPQASDEEIRKAYRNWAQSYHPDKHSPQVHYITPHFFLILYICCMCLCVCFLVGVDGLVTNIRYNVFFSYLFVLVL